jgi:acetolactate decarboxylase
MHKHITPSGVEVRTRISNTLYKQLQSHCQQTGESMDHVIQTALAQGLGVEHHTVYQISTSTALVEGVYQGCVTVGTIKGHGDFGLGTFDALNGEGIMLDGHIYQALSNGSVVEPDDSATAPFWVSTEFEADRELVLNQVSSWDDLCAQLDQQRQSENLFVAIRIDGDFDVINYRVVCRTDPGVSLVSATSHQAEFTVKHVSGTLMGFWSPMYARTLNIPGYHLHLLTNDHQHGGHVHGIRAEKVRVRLMDAANLVMALPETPQFLKADLSHDPAAALSKAEGPQK